MYKKLIKLLPFLFCLFFVACQQESAESFPQIEKAIQSVDSSFEKQSSTVAIPTVYSNSKGDKIVFYQCKTEYFFGEPPENQLNEEAIGTVVDLFSAESIEHFSIKNQKAVLIQKDGRNYLCWTRSPELSFVIEYDPNAVTEEEIYKMAESVS